MDFVVPRYAGNGMAGTVKELGIKTDITKAIVNIIALEKVFVNMLMKRHQKRKKEERKKKKRKRKINGIHGGVNIETLNDNRKYVK